MRKYLLFLILILAVLISYKITPILAQEENDRLEIEKVIQSFFKSSFANDLESSMKDISHNYSDSMDGKFVDYEQFKLIQEKLLNNMSKKYVNYSFSDLKTDKLDIQGNKATLEIEFISYGFNLDTVRKESRIQKRFIAIEKENGSWKIIKMRRLPVP
jgi:hypothetical protein